MPDYKYGRTIERRVSLKTQLALIDKELNRRDSEQRNS